MKKLHIPKLVQSRPRWKYTKESLSKFSGITSSKSFGSNIQFNSGNTQTVYKKWSKALNSAVYHSFKKYIPKKNQRLTSNTVKRLTKIKRIMINITKKGRVERELLSNCINDIQNLLSNEVSKINHDIIAQRAKTLSNENKFDRNSFGN